MNLTSPLTFIAQKLLYLWINSDVRQETYATTKDNKTKTVYVLASRAWTDLLVLEHECKKRQLTRPLSRIRQQQLKIWHSVYTIAPAQPLKAWLHRETKRSAMLNGLCLALKQNPELDIHFVPVVLFWGRPVLKQKHWLRVLFSDTWGFAGRTRRFFTILFNGKNTLLQFSPAISFREFINSNPETRNCVDEMQLLLARRLIEIKTATLGPDISHRRTLVRELLENKTIASAIRTHSKKDHISEYRATQIANRYLKEIVGDRSYITIQIMQRVLTTFWNRFYSGIDVHYSAELKQLALNHQLIYVPCHRSHIDYLLLSYVIHNEGLAIPYIAAGKNLNMPFIGSVLRKGGAFFMRRSFKDNKLYATVMFEYLASLVSSGMPVEYFVEGGRSRTGRLLQPKPGMLAMTIRAFLKYQSRPVAFVPVYIGYEKMIEGKTYLAELKGGSKKSETLLGSIRSVLNIRGFYGRVTTSFGQPVLLNEQLNELAPDWQKQLYNDSQRPDWLRQTVALSSQKIMQNINKCCAVNAVNLIATALLAAPNQTMDEGELIQTLDFYRDLIKHLEYSSYIRLTDSDAAKQIHHAQALKMVQRRQHKMGDFIYLDQAHAILLSYYRNNVLHLFVLPSLIACCFTNSNTISKEKIIYFIKIAYPFLKAEFFLPWSSSEIPAIIDHVLLELSRTGRLSYNEDTLTYSKPSISAASSTQLATLAQVISPVLELYYMVFALIAEQVAASSRQELENSCYLMAQRLALMYQINSPDFFDKHLIANFIDTLIKRHYVTVNTSERLEVTPAALHKGRQARRLLSKSMQHNILQMIRTSTRQIENE